MKHYLVMQTETFVIYKLFKDGLWQYCIYMYIQGSPQDSFKEHILRVEFCRVHFYSPSYSWGDHGYWWTWYFSVARSINLSLINLNNQRNSYPDGEKLAGENGTIGLLVLLVNLLIGGLSGVNCRFCETVGYQWNEVQIITLKYTTCSTSLFFLVRV